MLRLFTALLCSAAVALADSPPDRPLPPKPVEPVAVAPAVSVSLRTLNVKDGMVVTTVAVPVTETVPVTVTKTVNGQPVTVVEQVTVTKMVVQEKMTKLKDLKAKLIRRTHEEIREIGGWLQSVVRGWYQYYAIPGNYTRLRQFRDAIQLMWLRALRRRSQRGGRRHSLQRQGRCPAS